MNFKEIKPRQIIEDTWYNAKHVNDDWGVGTVVKVLKTRFVVKFSNKEANHSGDGVVTYDRSHAQFVRRISKKRKLKK